MLLQLYEFILETGTDVWLITQCPKPAQILQIEIEIVEYKAEFFILPQRDLKSGSILNIQGKKKVSLKLE